MSCIYRAYLGGLWGSVVHHHRHLQRLRGRRPTKGRDAYILRQEAVLNEAREYAMSETVRLGGYVPIQRAAGERLYTSRRTYPSQVWMGGKWGFRPARTGVLQLGQLLAGYWRKRPI